MLIRSCLPLRHPDADPSLPPDGVRLWWLVRSHPQQERRLAAELVAADVACYLPLGVRHGVTPLGRRWRRVIPLFPTYLFVLADESRHPALDASRRVSRVSRIDGQERFRGELASLDALFRAGGELRLGPVIHAASRVRVVAGPFEGSEGVVGRVGARSRVHVNLTTLGQSVSIELDMSQVEPAR